MEALKMLGMVLFGMMTMTVVSLTGDAMVALTVGLIGGVTASVAATVMMNDPGEGLIMMGCYVTGALLVGMLLI